MFYNGFYGYGGMFDSMLHILAWVIFIVIVIAIIKSVRGPRHGRGSWMGYNHMSAIETIRERFAKGEISKEEFEMMRKELEK